MSIPQDKAEPKNEAVLPKLYGFFFAFIQEIILGPTPPIKCCFSTDFEGFIFLSWVGLLMQ